MSELASRLPNHFAPSTAEGLSAVFPDTDLSLMSSSVTDLSLMSSSVIEQAIRDAQMSFGTTCRPRSSAGRSDLKGYRRLGSRPPWSRPVTLFSCLSCELYATFCRIN